MDYSDVVKGIRDNKKYALAGWNDGTEKNTFIFLSDGYQGTDLKGFSVLQEAGITEFYVSSRLCKRLATGEVIVGWVATNAETLSDKWDEVE